MRPDDPARRTSIDLLRTVAIVLMVVIHFVENLAGAGTAVHASWWLPTGFAAPIFTFLVGVNHRLWTAGRAARGATAGEISKATVRRGLFLVGLGFAFNVLVWMPEDVFNWDILTLIGLALVVLDVARRMPASTVLVACVLLLGMSPALRVAADYPAFWQAGWFDYEFTLDDVLLGWLVVGYFPVFPWLAFPLAGHLAAPLVFGTADAASAVDREPEDHSRPGALLVAATLAVLAAGALLAWPHLPATLRAGASRAWTMFPASTAYCLGTLALALAALAVFHRLLDRDPRPAWAAALARWTAPVSRHSLSIYLLHHVVHIWPLWLAGAASGDDPSALWQRALSLPAALAAAALCLVLCVAVARGMDRGSVPSVERFMRWLCD